MKQKTEIQQRKSVKPKAGWFSKKNKIDKPLARLSEMKKEDTKYQHQE